MAVASPQVELLISLFFSEDDVNFSYVSYISTSGITTLHTQDIFLEKIKNHANNLIGDHNKFVSSSILEVGQSRTTFLDLYSGGHVFWFNLVELGAYH